MVEQLDLFLQTVKEEEKTKPITEKELQKIHDKKYTQRKLKPSEWELYRLIKYNSEVLDRRTTQREICDKIPEYKWNDDPLAHDHCSSIWTAIKNLNESNEIEKVIISFNFEYWLGGKEETQVFLDKLWGDIEPRLKRYWTYLRKVKKNGQGKLLSAQLEPIDENSNAREWVESYIINKQSEE